MNLLLALLVTTVPLDTATFAGGCFWSMERAFDQVTGVVSATVGYTRGRMREACAAAAPPPEVQSSMPGRKPSRAELRQALTPVQYQVTQHEATEPPFRNDYWDNHRAGIYVDVVSGEPLFSSLDKFESGTGWPSFTRPLEQANISQKTDRSLFMTRT